MRGARGLGARAAPRTILALSSPDTLGAARGAARCGRERRQPAHRIAGCPLGRGGQRKRHILMPAARIAREHPDSGPTPSGAGSGRRTRGLPSGHRPEPARERTPLRQRRHLSRLGLPLPLAAHQAGPGACGGSGKGTPPRRAGEGGHGASPPRCPGLQKPHQHLRHAAGGQRGAPSRKRLGARTAGRQPQETAQHPRLGPPKPRHGRAAAPGRTPRAQPPLGPRRTGRRAATGSDPSLAYRRTLLHPTPQAPETEARLWSDNSNS